MGEILPRLASGIAGLDTVLCGGFVEGSSYIVQGRPGAGKTIFANQIAFEQVRQGRRVLYVTLLAEAHDRLFQSLSTLDFFDTTRLGDGISYVSVFQTLRSEGLHAVVSLLRTEIDRQHATVLVIDGLLNARDRAESTLDVKTFVAELQGHAAFANCTVLFLTSAETDEASPEHTMVDGVVELCEEMFGVRSVRQLRVRKARGSAVLGGYHKYQITGAGVTVFPRIEAVHATPSRDALPPDGRVPTGVAGLDPLLGGGLGAASMTLLTGQPGTGKTLSSISFVSAAEAGDKALFFGFYEPPSRVQLKARAIGIDLEPLLADDRLEIIWHPMTENLLDQLGHRLLDAVRARGVTRLAIDGLRGFERAAVDKDRLTEYFAALTNELRALGVTMLATEETQASPGIAGQIPELLSTFDNLLALQSRPLGVGNSLSVRKMRDTAYQPFAREVVISDAGIVIGGPIGPDEHSASGLAAYPRA